MVDAFERVFHKELTEARNDGISIGEKWGEERGEKRGEERGEKQGILKTLAALIRKGLLSLKDAASEAHMTEDEFTAQMAALGF